MILIDGCDGVKCPGCKQPQNRLHAAIVHLALSKTDAGNLEYDEYFGI